MKQFALLGTYTRRESEGIYQVALDTETGQLDDLHLIAKVGSPTYLTKDETHQIIYAIVNENDRGGIVALREKDGEWIRQSEVTAPGASPCYVAFDEERQLVYTANYHKGTVDVYQTTADGELTHLQTIQHEGHSVHENQKGPHTHYADLTPDKRYVLACDLGIDQVFTYEVTADHMLQEVSVLDTPAGFGPRHIAFHPNGQTAYLFGELSSEILVLAYDETTGSLDIQQKISTIPESHTAFNGGAALRVTADGKFLYASNRGHDSIAVYQILTDDTLELVEYVPTAGETPRDFNLDESEQYVLVGHQDSDQLTVFTRDSETGKLSELSHDFYAPEVVCVYF